MPLLRKTLDSDVTSGPIIEGMGLAAKRIRPALYQAHEFAGLAGVTIRTLHHYDRLGLLKPSRRTDAGYRLYNENDLVRLEQIIVLKFLARASPEADSGTAGPESARVAARIAVATACARGEAPPIGGGYSGHR